MVPTQNKNRIYAVLILCMGIVVSVWIYNQTPKILPSKNTNSDESNDVSVRPYISIDEKANDDWKKILTNIDKKNQTITNLTTNNPNTFDDTTLTAQMAKDFFSQYLIAKKGNRTLTEDDINTITGNVISSPQYSKGTGPVYVLKNLHIIQKIDKATIKKYQDEVNLILKKRSEQIQDFPMAVIRTGVTQNNEEVLKRLDPIIEIGNATIKDLIAVEVPVDAIEVHLGLVNASSNLITDLEDMRQAFVDPVRAFAGLSQYFKHATEFKQSLKIINFYFGNRLGKEQ